MALTLDLPPECATSPTRVDVLLLEAFMLWPDDQTARQRAMASGILAHARELAAAGVDREDMLSGLAQFALDVDPPETIRERARPRFVEGLVAGLVVWRALALNEHDPGSAAISKSVGDIAQRVWPAWRLSPKSINNKVLPRFRAVVHLWCAYAGAALEGADTFPCRTRDLPPFLATAEAYRARGEATRLPHAPTTVLRPGDAVTLPPELARRLPAIALKFLPASPH